MTTTLNWGILGAGNIAGTFAADLKQSRTGKAVAIASRTQAKADAFGDKHGIARRYGSYDALLADRDVQAVYIATPHPEHAEWAIKAANAGKHVLCEKPMGVNAFEVEAIIEAARAAGVFLMEAFMYRSAPQTAKILELVKSGAIGKVCMVHAAFGFHWPKVFDANSRLLSHDLAGGGILDVGCYPVSFARLIAGAAQGKPFAEPTDLKAMGHLESTGVDGYAAALLRFDGDLIAQVSTGVQLAQDNVARIYGSEGSILIPSPWAPAGKGGQSTITLHRGGQKEEIAIPADRPIYAIEADTVAEYLDRRESPTMPWADSLGNARALDRWRREIGVRYRFETHQTFPKQLPRPRKRVTGDIDIPHRSLPGLDKPVSQLVIGANGNAAAASVLFDAFFEASGNTFDTSYHYGVCDAVLGAWIQSRGVRDRVNILAKGAHTPYCNPKDLDDQIRKSLDALQTDHTELYIMHRDNPDVPVGEFVDVLNEHADAGRIGLFGGSNWTLQRFAEANAYSDKYGKRRMSVLSNNFSLARMVNPVWEGCIACSDPQSRAFLHEHNLPNFAWSSQARGFFVHGDPTFTSDKLLAHAWYSDDNFERLRRARELGQKYGITANNIALAYVLAQPHPLFALIGPANLDELRTTLPALTLHLTPDEIAWLNLER